jgi:hypothetical protein
LATTPILARAQNQDRRRIEIDKVWRADGVPLAVLGYSGEVAETLRFDLEGPVAALRRRPRRSSFSPVSNLSRQRGGWPIGTSGAAHEDVRRWNARKQAHALADDGSRRWAAG